MKHAKTLQDHLFLEFWSTSDRSPFLWWGGVGTLLKFETYKYILFKKRNTLQRCDWDEVSEAHASGTKLRGHQKPQ